MFPIALGRFFKVEPNKFADSLAEKNLTKVDMTLSSSTRRQDGVYDTTYLTCRLVCSPKAAEMIEGLSQDTVLSVNINRIEYVSQKDTDKGGKQFSFTADISGFTILSRNSSGGEESRGSESRSIPKPQAQAQARTPARTPTRPRPVVDEDFDEDPFASPDEPAFAS